MARSIKTKTRKKIIEVEIEGEKKIKSISLVTKTR